MKVSLVFLSLLLLLASPNSNVPSAPIGNGVVNETIQNNATPAELIDDRTQGQIEILVYNEYADLDSVGNNEFRNTMDAIDEQYGSDYRYQNLTDYSLLNLDLLSQYDVFLIPEQEKISGADNATAIGTAWEPFLLSWVEAGGIGILMSYEGGIGWGANIFNATGLMEFHIPMMMTGETGDVIDPGNALVRGLNASFTMPDGSVGFDTHVTKGVVEFNNYNMVTHEIYGFGHAVLLGFDNFNRSLSTDIILANAIRLTRHVIYDTSHAPNIEFSDIDYLVDDLLSMGFAVTDMQTWNQDIIDTSDVLILHAGGITYSPGHTDYIEEYVNNGGGVFIATEATTLGDTIDPVTERFGFVRNDTQRLDDADDAIGTNMQFTLAGKNIARHSATLECDSYHLYGGTWFIETPENAYPLLVTDTDNSTIGHDTAEILNGVVVAASLIYGSGRVVTLADFSSLTDIYYPEGNNAEFLKNSIRWLSAGGVREKIVLWNLAHSPWLSWPTFIPLCEDLTQNGYTIKWMTTFDQELITHADILVHLDGATPLTFNEINTIREFAWNGGGLIMLGDHSSYGVHTDEILGPLGLQRNLTTYLDDSDDYILYSSNLHYDANNIRPHPITEGISDLYVDQGTGFEDIGDWNPLVVTDNDDTAFWYSDGRIANEVPVFVAKEHNFGRIVVLTDYNFFDGFSDVESNGIPDYKEMDNLYFTLNAFQWLSENRPPIINMIWPNGGEVIGGNCEVYWNAEDPNGDSLLSTLYYSSNNGISWTILVEDTYDATFIWDTTTVPDTSEGRMRVIVTDLYLETSRTSEFTFIVDNVGPDIVGVQRSPETVLSSDNVTVIANVTDISDIESVYCQYRIDSGWWVLVPMTYVSGTEMTYECDIGRFSVNSTIEYRIYAVDDSPLHHESLSDVESFTVGQGITESENLLVIIIIIGTVGITAVIVIVLFVKKKTSE
jgi:uncharacterized membrane protein